MIGKIRKKIRGPAARVIVVILCIPFALFGAEIFLASALEQDDVIGEVNGKPLGAYEYSRLLDAAMLRLQQITPELDLESERLARNVALESAVRDELLVQLASDAQIDLPTTKIDDLLRSLPDFQENGQFNAGLFDLYARQSGVTRDKLRQSLARSLLLDTLNRTFLFPVTGAGRQEVHRLWLHSRDIEYLELTGDDFAPASLTEVQMRNYFQAQSGLFQTPEQVDIELVQLSEAEARRRADDSQVTQQSIEAEYQAYIDSLQKQTERRAAHIMLTWDSGSERRRQLEQASDLRRRLQQGEDFAELARQFSQDISAEQGGDLGFSSGDVFPQEFELALADMEAGQVSEPIEIDDAVHIVKLTELRAPPASSLEQSTETLVEELRQKAADTIRSQLQDQMTELAYASATLQEIADETGLPVESYAGLQRRGAGGETAGLAADPALQAAAFSPSLIADGLVSDPVRLTDGAFVLLQVKQHHPAKQQSFEEAGDRVRTLLTAQLRSERQLQAAAAVENLLGEGASLTEAAQRHNLPADAKTLKGLKRSSALLDPVAMRRIFSLPADAAPVWERVQLENGDLVLVRLLAVYLSSPTEQELAEAPFFGPQLDSLRSRMLFTQLHSILRRQADIYIKPGDVSGLTFGNLEEL